MCTTDAFSKTGKHVHKHQISREMWRELWRSWDNKRQQQTCRKLPVLYHSSRE